jgi:hypothetical protein
MINQSSTKVSRMHNKYFISVNEIWKAEHPQAKKNEIETITYTICKNIFKMDI